MSLVYVALLIKLQGDDYPTVLATLAALGKAGVGTVDRARLNVHGSSLAAGHPFAATGARIIATVAKQLQERGGGRALVSICTAGGMGVVAIVER